jgi:uncharacterized protein YjbI with pentapeptide repeats
MNIKEDVEQHKIWLESYSQDGKRFTAIKQDLSKAKLSGVNLAEANLSGANLSGADLSKINLSETDLNKTIFISANLSEANLSNANLSDADLSFTNLSKANLSETNLTTTNLKGAKLNGANLSKTNLSFVDLSKTNLNGADLSEANLSKTNLSEAYLSKTDLSESDLSEANLNKTYLISANLSGANLSGTNLSEANLNEANLSFTDLSKTNLNKTSFISADLSGANLVASNLRGVNLSNANLSGANLGEADLSFTNLIFADLRGTNLKGANLNGADLNGADLSFAKLSKANLNGANLNGADLSFAKLSKANLNKANLSFANLSYIDFSGADLSGANLGIVQALGTNFTLSTLTGACIEDWHINASTVLENIKCQAIYMKQDEDGRYTDRRPSSENKSFADGDFAKLVRKALSTVDLIFRNGLDWKALAMSMERFRVESEGIELAIQAIENKGEGDFVIRVDAPIDANKAEIEKFLKREYKLARNALESKYKSQLESKDRELDSTRQHNTNLTEIVKLMAARPITIENKNIGASTFMTDSSSKVNQTFQGPIYGVAGNVEGNQNIYAPEQKQNLAEAAAEIQQLLEQLSATYPTTTITEKSVIATKAIEALEKNPAQKAKIIKAVKAGGIAALKELVEPVMKPITNILFPILEALSEE